MPLNGSTIRRTLAVVVIAVLASIVWVRWAQFSSSAVTVGVADSGPQIVLFRGDDSAGCRAIHQLVDEAEVRYAGRIGVTKVDWAPGDPLIRRYKVMFLPTVVFIDNQGQERKRLIGESSTVHAELREALIDAETLLRE